MQEPRDVTVAARFRDTCGGMGLRSTPVGVILLFVGACSRNQAAPPAAEAGVATAAPSAAPVVPPAVLGEGGNDYRGTLGKGTAIAVHLEKSGSIVRGAYVYEAVGRPIALEGAVDARGVLTLTEAVGGKSTGMMRLEAREGALLGEWSNPAATKRFPVRLAAAPPAAATQGGADGGLSPSALAEACLRNPGCPAEEAERLFIAAEDAHAADADCHRFARGEGVRKDLVRARACFERTLRTTKCAGSSAFLAMADLACMRIDGVGGPADIAGARKVFEDCFEDTTKATILEHAAKKERDPNVPPLDLCESGGATQLVFDECQVRARASEATRSHLQAKTIFVELDSTGRSLFAKANAAHEAYVHEMFGFAYEVYREGSIRYAMGASRAASLENKRRSELAEFSAFTVDAVTKADVTKAQSSAKTALQAVTTATPEEARALAKTQTAWTAYRDAEVALYEHAFGPKFGADKVRATMRVRLETRRAKEVAPPSAQEE